MNKILILLLATMCSCEQEKQKSKETYPFSYHVGFGDLKLVNIDSCEYLYGEWGNATVLTHKGNCKYCTQRIKH
jgi:hypothetical protein